MDIFAQLFEEQKNMRNISNHQRSNDRVFYLKSEDFYYSICQSNIILLTQRDPSLLSLSKITFTRPALFCKISTFGLKTSFYIFKDYSISVFKTSIMISTIECELKSTSRELKGVLDAFTLFIYSVIEQKSRSTSRKSK